MGDPRGPKPLTGNQYIVSEIRGVLDRIWLESGNCDPMPGVAEDENLFDAGIVDSFTMLEVIAVVEELTGEAVDFLETDPETFFTIRGMASYVNAHHGKA